MAADLTVMSARAVKAAVSAAAQRFSSAAGRRVTFEFAPVGALEKKLLDGARCDAVILSSSAIAAMVAAGHVVHGSERELGRMSIGVCVRADGPLPDVSTPDEFRALLMRARAISVSDPAVGGTAARYMPQLFARMGIADVLEPKLVRCSGGDDVAERVARGEAEIGITFISEMLAIAGVTVAGPLPAVYGNDTVYCAAVHAQSADPEGARALIAAVGDQTTDAVWRSAGFAR
jgi:molybdate transport system substrate-binding protein